MKIALRHNRRTAGLLLVECVVYLGLLFVVLGLAYCVFYQGWDNEKKLRGNATQIIRTMNLGEHWREQVRAATGPLRIEETAEGQVLHIPQGRAEVLYRFSQRAVWIGSGRGSWKPVLDRVQKSEMVLDPRQRTQAVRWELELLSREKRRVQPLFTFLAVPGVAAPVSP